MAIYWLSRHRPPRWTIAPIAVGVVLFAIESARQSWPGGEAFFDFFTAYYPAGVAAFHHDPAALTAVTSRGVAGFVNMPIVAYLFAPFVMFGPAGAVALFTALGVGLTVAAWGLLAKLAQLETRERLILAWLFLANGPLLNAILLGNTSHIVLFALIAGLVLMRAGRSGAAGALLGLTAILKPPLLLFGVFFLLRRDARGVAGFAASCGAVVLASLAVFGWADNVHWFEACILPFSHDWVAAINVQSIDAFAARLSFGTDVLGKWEAYPPTPGERLLAEVMTATVFLAAIFACLKRPAGPSPEPEGQGGTRRDLQYMLVICLALVASPLSWSHYYAWLLIPTAFFLRLQPSLPLVGRWLGWTAVALIMPPLSWLEPSNPLVAKFYVSVFVSHFLFGGLLWFGLLGWRLARSGGWLTRLKTPQGDLVGA